MDKTSISKRMEAETKLRGMRLKIVEDGEHLVAISVNDLDEYRLERFIKSRIPTANILNKTHTTRKKMDFSRPRFKHGIPSYEVDEITSKVKFNY